MCKVGNANEEHFSGENLSSFSEKAELMEIVERLTNRVLPGWKANAFEIAQKSELCLLAPFWKGQMLTWIAFSKMDNVLSELFTVIYLF